MNEDRYKDNRQYRMIAKSTKELLEKVRNAE